MMTSNNVTRTCCTDAMVCATVDASDLEKIGKSTGIVVI